MTIRFHFSKILFSTLGTLVALGVALPGWAQEKFPDKNIEVVFLGVH